MTCALTTTTSWQRSRAAILHEHFCGIRTRLKQRVSTLTEEIERMSQLVNGRLLNSPDDDDKEPRYLKGTVATLLRAWGDWKRGGETADALLLDYKPGCGGKKAMPYELVLEIQRRCTLPTGGRDKHGRAPIAQVMQTICDDFASRRPLPGVDYGKFPPGAEFPWSYRTVLRKKPGKAMRALGNLGIAAHKAQAAYVSMDYSRLRKCELYTLDDVRLDILAIDEATAKPVEIVVYVLMEAASRLIVAYILKPAAAIRASDVDELLAAGLQTPGFGIGADYVTHILFERGSTACSEGAQRVLETVLGELVINGAPLPRIRVHRTGMNGGVRWIGAPRDKASGNAAGKGVIESFHRRLHSALLHLPGQRGNNRDNQPASLGMESSESFTAGGLAAEAQKLAQFQIAADAVGSRCALRLGMLYVRQLADCVRDAIKAHNGEAGHAYRGHGSHHEAEIAPGVWQRTESTPEPIPMPARNIHFESAPEDDAPSPKGAPQNSPGQRPGSSPREGASPVGAPHQYHLNTPAPSGFVKLTNAQKNAIYFGAWNKVQLANPRLDRFAITRRTLGAVPKPLEMTAGQFEKMLAVFNAIVRDAKSADPF